jgi:hypothetical protein
MKPKPQNQKRNDQQSHNHQRVQKAQGAKSRQDHITNIHKQTQDNTLIPITNLSGRAAPAMPNANPTSPHKKAANAVLKAGIGLAKADAEFLEDARDKLLLCEVAVAARDGQIPDV